MNRFLTVVFVVVGVVGVGLSGAVGPALVRGAEPNRPQQPQPPFPYTAREVVIDRTETDLTGTDTHFAIAGTLTVPSASEFGPGPHACAILITGSGAQDRDETIFGHKPFLVIADMLARRGVAVLRLDDRGVGGSGGAGAGVTTTSFAGDISAAAKFAAAQPEIDGSRIGLIGHSEGGLIAPMVAAEHPDQIAFVVMLSGTGVNGQAVLVEQMRAILHASGAQPEFIERASAAQAALLTAYTTAGVSVDDRRLAMRRLAMIQMMLDPDKPTPPDAEKTIDAAVRAGTAQFTSAWMIQFLALEPREFLLRVECPVLVLSGGKDTQVIASQNVPPIVSALLEGGNTDVTARVFPHCNHLFQEAQTGAVAEYGQIEQTMSTEVLETLGGWVVWAVRK